MTAALQAELSTPQARLATFEIAPGTAKSGPHHLAMRDLRDAASLWRLCWTLGWLDIKLRYRGSLLGPFWLTLSTAIMVAAMGGIYAALFHMDLQDYLPFLVLSLVLWNFLSALVGDACQGFLQNEGMIRSLRMPFTLYAARIVIRNVLILAHNLVVIVAVFAIFHVIPGPQALAALPGFAVWLVDSLAAAVLLGALCSRFRDVPPIVASVVQMAFFVTPVIWKADLLSPERRAILPLNPFYCLLEIVRAPLLGTLPTPLVYAAALGFSAALLGLAWLLFARVRGRIAFWV